MTESTGANLAVTTVDSRQIAAKSMLRNILFLCHLSQWNPTFLAKQKTLSINPDPDERKEEHDHLQCWLVFSEDKCETEQRQNVFQ